MNARCGIKEYEANKPKDKKKKYNNDVKVIHETSSTIGTQYSETLPNIDLYGRNKSLYDFHF